MSFQNVFTEHDIKAEKDMKIRQHGVLNAVRLSINSQSKIKLQDIEKTI